MSRKQYRAPGSSHEKKVSRKERKEQLKQAQAEREANQPTEEELVPTDQDLDQLKKITFASVTGILLLLAIMYYVFITNS
jgi:hypothetical protein